ncbi:hypothetical protein N7475_005142 [Penicillium sp. IBT 31633x]|nr:hypothetical protein N7475_005142 [Penicillium sp. IBT 31633x]
MQNWQDIGLRHIRDFIKTPASITHLDANSHQHVYDSVLNHWNVNPAERPIETLHPLVTTHPVTGYKVLNLNSGFVTRLDGLKRYESDKLLELLYTNIHTAQDHMVRFQWEKNSVAFWDNSEKTGDYSPVFWGQTFRA